MRTKQLSILIPASVTPIELLLRRNRVHRPVILLSEVFINNLVNEIYKAILTGATGMIGEGVLHECLLHDDVEEVLVVGRRSCGVSHPKLKEIIVPDFFDLSAIENKLTGYNACFFAWACHPSE